MVHSWKSRLAAIIFAIACSVVAANAANVTVSGTDFLLDGKPWIPKGVVLVGSLAPAEDFKRSAYAKAYESFTPDLLQQIKRFGADVVRLKANAFALDPQSPQHKPDYRDKLLAIVQQVRDAGFIVIVSMLEPGTFKGDPSFSRMPSEATGRAWAPLIPRLGKDRGVILELFDEPSAKEPSRDNWEKWRAGMQSTVDSVRRAGAENVVLLDGLRNGHILDGAPKINDPLGQLGYAVHPYLTRRNNEPREWDHSFGNFAKSRPVMATEWNALSNRPAQCEANTPETVQQFFAYLRRLRVGLVLWAYDLPGVQRDGVLTSFKGHRCGPGTLFGAGEAVKEYFAAH
jgi:hypothetical protein